MRNGRYRLPPAFTEYNWHRAQAGFQRAIELAPNDGSVKFALGLQLAALGEVEQAIGLTRAALDGGGGAEAAQVDLAFGEPSRTTACQQP